MSCTADAFMDGEELRPIGQPNKLVWRYRPVKGGADGDLETRDVVPCPCGCGRFCCDGVQG